MYRVLAVFAVILTALSASAQQALSYPHLIVFSDNYSDTLNTYNATATSSTGVDQDGNTITIFDAYPITAYGYQDGTFTNGFFYDPLSFFQHDPFTYIRGVWHEQLHDQLPGVPYAASPIEEGVANPFSNNYAWGSATTGNGTTTVSFAGHFTVAVHNMNQQVTDYLNAGNTPDAHSLYVLFGGLNDLLQDSSSTNITAAAANVTAEAKRLIDAGAVNLLIANVPGISSNSSSPIDVAAASFRTQLAADLAALQAQYALNNVPNHITTLDLYTLYANIMAAPGDFGFTNVMDKANLLPNGFDGNTYLNWDGVNPTTEGHHQIAIAACTALTGTATTLTADKTTATLAAPATLTATVSTAGTYGPQSTFTPTGSVTFYYSHDVSGTVTPVLLGTVPIDVNGRATITTAGLAAGTTYDIYAVYSGDTNFPPGCNSKQIGMTIIVATQSFSFSIDPTAAFLGMEEGAPVGIQVSPIGGFTGPVTISCGPLPEFFSCIFDSSPTVQLNNSLVSFGVSLFIATKLQQTGAVITPPISPHNDGDGPALAALCTAPLLLLMMWRRRKLGALRQVGLLMLVLALSIGLLSAAGCGGATQNTASQNGDPGFGTTHGPGITYAVPGQYFVNIIATSGSLHVTQSYPIYIADTYDVGVTP